jgi:protein-tyrosine phosphatase
VFDSIFNFRDVGGCLGADGRPVRTGMLYRSDSLATLSDTDIVTLGGLGIRTVIDLRRAVEVEKYGRIADVDGRRYYNIPPQHELWEESGYDEQAGPARFLADRYAELARDGADGFGQALRIIADADAAPTVVHCFAGKDRTGVLIGLTLALVGVDDDAIALDYGISEAWSASHAPAELPKHWTLAPAETMTMFLDDLRRTYGSIERYAESAGIGPDSVTALRSTLLDS